MLALMARADDLDTPPAPDELGNESTSFGIAARLLSLGLGLLVGAAVATFPQAVIAIEQGFSWSLLVSLLAALALFPALRQSAGRVDVRIVLATASVLLFVPVLVPGLLPAGGWRLFVTFGAILAVLSAVVLLRVRGARKDVVAWNRAYAHLARSPRRAAEARLALEREQIGNGHRFAGSVEYVDETGERHVVPATSARRLRLVYTADQVVTSDSACVVWHSPDHSVVLTKALMTGV